jgi:hypothetical protein
MIGLLKLSKGPNMPKERLITLLAIILAAAMSRVMPHPVNVAPITAIALFAGAHFSDRRLAFGVPLMAMLASDVMIGFYSGMWVTYLAFALTVCIGMKLKGRVRPMPVAAASVAGSVLFFLVTNFALWPGHTLYPHTLEGIVQSYAAALPFFQNSLLGDLFYTTLLFGGFALAERRFAPLKA